MTQFQECLKMAAATAAVIFTCLACATAIHRYDMKKLKDQKHHEEMERERLKNAGRTIVILNEKFKKSPRKR